MTNTLFTPRPAASPDARHDMLASLRARTKHFVPFREGYLEAPVVRADHETLVYRSGNGRLYSELVARGQSREQQDDASHQQLLHELLVEKAQDPNGPIFEELERYAKQTEPLLVTGEGIVLNGNRRLASMRELLAQDPDRYGGFEQVDVAVLPSRLSDSDLEYIEAALQMSPELKLEYSWVNRRLKLREHVELRGAGNDAVLAAYRFKNSKAAETELAQLEMAEKYLQFIGQPRNYRHVEDLEDAFVDMQRQLGSFSNARLIELWTYGGFAILAARNKLDIDFDTYFPFARPVPFELVHWVMRSFGEECDFVEPQGPGQNTPVDLRLANALTPIVQDCDQAERVARRLIALSDRLRANQEQEIGGAQAVHHLRQARTSLQKLDLESLAPDQLRELRSELVALDEFLGELRSQGRSADPDVRHNLLSRLLGKE